MHVCMIGCVCVAGWRKRKQSYRVSSVVILLLRWIRCYSALLDRRPAQPINAAEKLRYDDGGDGCVVGHCLHTAV